MRISIISFLIGLFVSILIDYGIFRTLKSKCRTPRWPRAYALSAVVCWVYLTVVYLLPKRDADEGILYLMWLLYAYCTLYAAKAVYLAFALIDTLPMLFGRRRWKSSLFAGIPLALATLAVMWWGALAGRSRMEVIHQTIYSEKLPAAFEGYRIAQFSDIHVGTWGNDTAFISRLVDTILAQKPDLILFTGDIVNRKTTELRPFLHVLSRLHAPDGVYSILGNHDYGDYITWKTEALHLANNRQLDTWQRKMGWHLLNNDHSFIAKPSPFSPDSISISGDIQPLDSLVLIGVENWGEPPFRQYGDLRRAYPTHPDSMFNTHDKRFKILMTHNPEHWRRVTGASTNIDLTLSGHTHAMQFQIKEGNFKWSPSQYVYKLWGGLYTALNKEGQTVQLYVNIGAGEVGMPFRIGATPEVTLFTLRRGTPPPPSITL